MNVVCYEHGLLQTGLLWMCFVMNWFVCYDLVCYERSRYELVCDKRGLSWTGLFQMVCYQWSVMSRSVLNRYCWWCICVSPTLSCPFCQKICCIDTTCMPFSICRWHNCTCSTFCLLTLYVWCFSQICIFCPLCNISLWWWLSIMSSFSDGCTCIPTNFYLVKYCV